MKIWHNPVFRKELRALRRRRTALALAGWNLLLALGIATYLTAIAARPDPYMAQSDRFQIVLAAICLLQLILVLSAPPSITAQSIAGERESRTWELLRVTTLTHNELIWGKFMTAMVWALLPVAAIVPFQIVLAVLTHLPWWEWLTWLAVLTILAATPGAIGLCCSAAIRSAQAARLATMGIVFALIISSLVLFFVSLISDQGSQVLIVAGALWPAAGLLSWRLANWCLKRNILF